VENGFEVRFKSKGVQAQIFLAIFSASTWFRSLSAFVTSSSTCFLSVSESFSSVSFSSLFIEALPLSFP
jgi:hypothetical protein